MHTYLRRSIYAFSLFYLDIGISSEGRYIGGGHDKSAPTAVQISQHIIMKEEWAPTAVQISQHIIMKEECSETTLFRTTEENALRIYFRKPDTTICCGLRWNINREHNTYKDRFFSVPCR